MGWAKKAAAEMGMFDDTSSDDELNLGYNGHGRNEWHGDDDPSHSEDETDSEGEPAQPEYHLPSDVEGGTQSAQCSPYDEDDFENGKKLCSDVKSLHQAIQLDFDELIREARARGGFKAYDDSWMPNAPHPPPKTETEEVRKIY